MLARDLTTAEELHAMTATEVLKDACMLVQDGVRDDPSQFVGRMARNYVVPICPAAQSSAVYSTQSRRV